MKERKAWATIGVVVLLLTVTAFTGCVSKSEYEALQANGATLLQENNSLEADVARTQSDLANLQADYDALNADYDTMKADYDELNADYDTMNADYDGLNADYGAVSAELAEIKEVYPPRYFKDYDELQDWLDKALPEIDTDKTEEKQHLDLQELALLDGYIWSVYWELRRLPVSCVIVGDSVYRVSISTGDITWIAWR